jgi:hypothetical protein
MTTKLIDIIKKEFPFELTHYDLATSILTEGFAESLTIVNSLCTLYFGKEYLEEVRDAFNDFKEL